MIRRAYFSTCRKFRYSLYREWDNNLPIAMCVGLNPSNANAEKDDPTIRLLIKHLGAKGYGGFYMVNLYALISSDPEIITQQYNDQEKNNACILHIADKKADDIIFCWGDFKQAWFPSRKWIRLYKDRALCFGKTKAGAPMHPRKALMYLKEGTKAKLQKYE